MKTSSSFPVPLILTAFLLFAGCPQPKSGPKVKFKSNADNPSNPDLPSPSESKTKDSEAASSPRSGSGKKNSPSAKTLRLPLRSSGLQTLDPALATTLPDRRIVSQIYEPLLQYKYLKRPLELEPLLLESMPTVDEDGMTYHFRLKKGIRFHDASCFRQGKGRSLTTDDVFYSWKRLDDGLSIAKMKKIDDLAFTVTLTEPNPRFLWMLADPKTSIVPREAIEKWGTRFGVHPVGTGPFTLQEKDWTRNQRLILHRNPNYHTENYPSESMPEDGPAGRTGAAGKRLPILDQIEVVFYDNDTRMWNDFRQHKLGLIPVPAQYDSQAFVRPERKLDPVLAQEGIRAQVAPLLDFCFLGFNMEDQQVGGNTPQRRALRQAISEAIDWNARNQKFYHGTCVLYRGMIPPGLDGWPSDSVVTAPQPPDLDHAKQRLADAGYPNGKGLPELELFSSNEAPNPEMVAMIVKQLAPLGVKIKPRLDDFHTLMNHIDQKEAPLFLLAWTSDYPDAENNLALFYGPHHAPGVNHFNYQNKSYDSLYERIRKMRPGIQRTALAQTMQEMVMKDCPFSGSLQRTRPYLVQPEVKNFKATENFDNWYKYLDVDSSP